MTTAPQRRLSKSRLVAGAQCEKLLWWKVHEPDAEELAPDSVQQSIFDSGHRVGALAQTCFPGGIEVSHSPALQEMVEATSAALQTETPAIFEASFIADGVFVAVDVLLRSPAGWTIIEVKSTKSVKEYHLLDAAIQLHVVRAAGLEVSTVEVMHLGTGTHSSSADELLVRSDITEEAEAWQPALPDLIDRLGEVLEGDTPEVAVGPHCRQPRTCPFYDRCTPPPPLDATSRLYRLPKRDLEALLELGHDTVRTIPESYPLRPIADRQRRAISTGRMVLEAGLRPALDQIQLPAAYIDFESIAPAIPPFPGCTSYGQLPVQVSCHRIEEDGSMVHHEWLGEPGEDPRPGLAGAVLAACRGAQTLVAYSAGFEKQMIRSLAAVADAPDAKELLGLCDRFVDLLPIMRNHVYHPDFGGTFGLKAVTAALLPGLAYDDLEVRAGGDASVRLADLIIRGEPADPTAQADLQAHLLAYCKRDTWTMVELVRVLRAATNPGQGG